MGNRRCCCNPATCADCISVPSVIPVTIVGYGVINCLKVDFFLGDVPCHWYADTQSGVHNTDDDDLSDCIASMFINLTDVGGDDPPLRFKVTIATQLNAAEDNPGGIQYDTAGVGSSPIDCTATRTATQIYDDTGGTCISFPLTIQLF